VQAALEGAGIEPEESGLTRFPTTLVSLPADQVQKVLRLLETIEEHQDVQEVYTTLNVDESTVAELG
jgi:transcriptional/translational regulatory protein YebC/TACO1